MNNLLLGLLVIDANNLQPGNATGAHDHANDHGPAITLGPLSLFQTDGLGEDVQPVAHDVSGLGVSGLDLSGLDLF